MSAIISLLVDVLSWLIIIHLILSFFMSPYHPLREAIGRIVEPMLAPIRRYVPPVGGLDFSPMVLILLLQIVGVLLANLLARF